MWVREQGEAGLQGAQVLLKLHACIHVSTMPTHSIDMHCVILKWAMYMYYIHTYIHIYNVQVHVLHTYIHIYNVHVHVLHVHIHVHAHVDLHTVHVYVLCMHLCCMCMTCDAHTPGHPSTANEAWYRLKCVLCIG